MSSSLYAPAGAKAPVADAGKPASLSILVVNWNGGDLLRRTIAAIGAAPPEEPAEVLVVDNASTDDSVAWLEGGDAQRLLGSISLRLLKNQENLGFSRANNQGIRNTVSPLLLLLNSDTEVQPGSIDALVRGIRSEERIGACGPRLLYSDGSLQTSVWRNPPTLWDILASGLGLHRLLPARLRGELLLGAYWDHGRRRCVPMLSGAALLVKRSMVDEIGGLDERFHMYGEDNEWCLRMTRGGWRLLFEPEALVVHHCHSSSTKRWTREEQARQQLEAYLSYQRYCLPYKHVRANLLGMIGLLRLQQSWRRVRRRSFGDVQLQLDVYARHLKELSAER